jgi:hypothetical protein
MVQFSFFGQAENAANGPGYHAFIIFSSVYRIIAATGFEPLPVE